MTDDVSAKMDSYFGKYHVRKYTKGQVLILNGDTPDHVLHLVKGKVKQYDVTYKGDEIIVNVFKPPAFFPMSLAINQGENHYIFEAETDIEVHKVPNEEMIAFLKANNDVMYDLLSRLYRGMDGVLSRMTSLMASSAKNRMILELVIEARRFGKKQPDGGCIIDISEKDLGARAGLSRETISREISKLKKENLLEIQSKSILIKNLAAIERKLEQEV